MPRQRLCPTSGHYSRVRLPVPSHPHKANRGHQPSSFLHSLGQFVSSCVRRLPLAGAVRHGPADLFFPPVELPVSGEFVTVVWLFPVISHVGILGGRGSEATMRGGRGVEGGKEGGWFHGKQGATGVSDELFAVR